MAERIVVALGGNALGKTPQEQSELISATASSVVDLVQSGNRVIVTHGNGPQVGMINLALDTAAKEGISPHIPLAECGAMSQGYIGYHLQQAIGDELDARQLDIDCASIVTQTVVDAQDPAFQKPTKPVGAFYTEEEAKVLAEHTGNQYVEDSGRGWRRVVASPLPTTIREARLIRRLVDCGTVIVAAGGGGVPVIRSDRHHRGVIAVVDKDRTAALMAKQLEADALLILMAADKVYLNYNKPEQKGLDRLTAVQAREYIAQGQFDAGSMLPKIEACVDFVENNYGKRAIITSLAQAADGFVGKTGTTIVSE